MLLFRLYLDTCLLGGGGGGNTRLFVLLPVVGRIPECAEWEMVASRRWSFFVFLNWGQKEFLRKWWRSRAVGILKTPTMVWEGGGYGMLADGMRQGSG